MTKLLNSKTAQLADAQFKIVQKTNTRNKNTAKVVAIQRNDISFADDDLTEIEVAKKIGFVFAQIIFEMKKIKQDDK
jgi:hypothetical protein